MSDNSHQMTTRSKSKDICDSEKYESSDMITDDILTDDSSVDENGNLKGFIDYDCDDDFDHKELDKQLYRLKGVKPKRKKRNIKKSKQNDKKLNDVFMTYLIMKATEKANLELKKNRKQKKRNKVKIEVSDDDSESVEQIVLDEPSTPGTPKKDLNTILTLDFGTDSDDTSFQGSDNKSDISLDSISENSSDNSSEETNHSEISTPKEEKTDKLEVSEESDEDYSFEYDENDEKYEELIDKQMLKNSEENA